MQNNSDHEIEYILRRATTISTEIDYEPELPYPPDIFICDVFRRQIQDVQIAYADMAVAINRCTVELVYGKTDIGEVFRAYRICKIDSLTATDYPDHKYPVYLECANECLGELIVRDGDNAWYYLIDRWYMTETEAYFADNFETDPDLLAAIHQMTIPLLRQSDEVTKK